jgi:transcriptional regulator with XRE-family HTH domain
MNDWAQRVRDYRAKSGLTQEALAALFGVDPRSVRRWEAGDVRPALVVRNRLLRSPVAIVKHPTTEAIAQLIAASSGFSCLLTTSRAVIASSPAYERRMIKAHGDGWQDLPFLTRLSPEIAATVEPCLTREGGMDAMLKRGLTAMTHDFLLPRHMGDTALRFTASRLFIDPCDSVLILTSYGVQKQQLTFQEPALTYIDEIVAT